MRRLTAVLAAAVGLVAQAPAPKAAPTPPPRWIQAAATAAGATAGALIGARGVSFSGVPADQRTAHEWRAGLTFAAIGSVLGATAASPFTPETAPSHSFWLDQWNTPLLFGVGVVQGLDFSSTRYFRDRGKDEWLLTNSLVDHEPQFAATEISAASAGIGLMYLFHRSGHHKIERWTAAAYIAVGIVSAVANYRYPATGHALF